MPDPFDLDRFVRAQESVFNTALTELRRGHKETHWMWFVFPQLKGLGSSPMAERFGLAGIQEARAYLRHSVLGPRLIACVEALLEHPGKTAEEIFGHVDAMKLRSCLTLFRDVDPSISVFFNVLGRYFGGVSDPRTMEMLKS